VTPFDPNVPVPLFILTIGDELLSGERVDLNGPWLARTLEPLGFVVREMLTVGDEEGPLMDALSRALLLGGLVVTSGGLGPTSDDRTRDVVARLLGRPLQVDPDIVAQLEQRYRARGLPGTPEPALKMAGVPLGAETLPNPRGVAPGLAIAEGNRRCVLLPGVPVEFKAIVESAMIPRLDAWFPHRAPGPVSALVHTTGIAESVLSGQLEPALAEGGGLAGASWAYRPSLRGVELRFSAVGGEAPAVLQELLRRAEPVLAPYRIEAGSGDLAEWVLRLCGDRNWRIALAESCTGGMVAARLTAVPGSSRAFLGGVVAYDNRVKQDLLEVPATLLNQHGAVSGPVVEAMAQGVARRFGAEVALSVSGVAGPGGGTEAKPVGEVWFALSSPLGGVSWRQRFPGERDEVRERATQHALHRMAQALAGSSPISG